MCPFLLTFKGGCFCLSLLNAISLIKHSLTGASVVPVTYDVLVSIVSGESVCLIDRDPGVTVLILPSQWNDEPHSKGKKTPSPRTSKSECAIPQYLFNSNSENQNMQNRDLGSRSGIIDLLRAKNQQEKKNTAASASASGDLSKHSSLDSSTRAARNSLHQASASQIGTSPLGSPHLNNVLNMQNHHSLLLQQQGHSFLPNSVSHLSPNLTAHQRDLLLLHSLQGTNTGLLGLQHRLGVLQARALGSIGGLTPTLPFMSGIDSAMMPTANNRQQAMVHSLNPSLRMAGLKANKDPQFDSMISKRSESFPEKLHRLLLEVEYEGSGDIISFTHDGLAFQIHKPKEFFDKIVPKYFNQSHLSSFKRQLNLYGFEAMTSGALKGAYYHQDFQKLRPELCRLIHRRNQKWRSPETK